MRDEVLRKCISDVPTEGMEHQDLVAYENLPYEESHKDIISYNGEFSLVNLGPERVFALQAKVEAGEVEDVDLRALQIATAYWGNQRANIEMGEPYRGSPPQSNDIDSLSDCISGERVTHVFSMGFMAAPEEKDEGLIDFSMLNGDE